MRCQRCVLDELGDDLECIVEDLSVVEGKQVLPIRLRQCLGVAGKHLVHRVHRRRGSVAATGGLVEIGNERCKGDGDDTLAGVPVWGAVRPHLHEVGGIDGECRLFLQFSHGGLQKVLIWLHEAAGECKCPEERCGPTADEDDAEFVVDEREDRNVDRHGERGKVAGIVRFRGHGVRLSQVCLTTDSPQTATDSRPADPPRHAGATQGTPDPRRSLPGGRTTGTAAR